MEMILITVRKIKDLFFVIAQNKNAASATREWTDQETLLLLEVLYCIYI